MVINKLSVSNGGVDENYFKGGASTLPGAYSNLSDDPRFFTDNFKAYYSPNFILASLDFDFLGGTFSTDRAFIYIFGQYWFASGTPYRVGACKITGRNITLAPWNTDFSIDCRPVVASPSNRLIIDYRIWITPSSAAASQTYPPASATITSKIFFH